MSKMTAEQWRSRRDLIADWANHVIDGCDLDTLRELAYTNLTMGMDDLSEEELIQQFELAGFNWNEDVNHG